MIAAALSAIVTTPLGFGRVSGVAFVIGMLFAWIAGLMAAATWGVQKFRGKRTSS